MARKGKNTAIVERELIIEHHKEGKSLREIATMVKRPRSTVQYIIKRFVEEKRIVDAPRNLNRKKLTPRDERFVMRKIRDEPKTTAVDIAKELNQRKEVKICPETVRNVLRKNDYHARVPRKKKPFISLKNKKLRFDFAKQHENTPVSYWEDVIFVDESKFNIFGSDGRRFVWRKPNDELNVKNLKATVKHGGGGVMVWGCMSAKGVGNLVFIDGIMDQNVYLKILKENLKESASKMGLGKRFKFYQDNDPKHKAQNVRLWLLYNCSKVIDTPPQSPDINPIENLWEYLDKKVRKHQISNQNDLKKCLMDEWEKIPTEYTQKLVNSIPKRLKAVAMSRGYHTKY